MDKPCSIRIFGAHPLGQRFDQGNGWCRTVRSLAGNGGHIQIPCLGGGGDGIRCTLRNNLETSLNAGERNFKVKHRLQHGLIRKELGQRLSSCQTFNQPH